MLDDYLNEILLTCAEEFGVTKEDVVSASKKQELVYCRKAFSIVVKEMLDIKLEVMAKKLNRTENSISIFIARQPDNKYYNACLHRIKKKTKPFWHNDNEGLK